jgi:hypothetical protein
MLNYGAISSNRNDICNIGGEKMIAAIDSVLTFNPSRIIA